LTPVDCVDIVVDAMEDVGERCDTDVPAGDESRVQLDVSLRVGDW
jgi:hypothetical protein